MQRSYGYCGMAPMRPMTPWRPDQRHTCLPCGHCLRATGHAMRRRGLVFHILCGPWAVISGHWGRFHSSAVTWAGCCGTRKSVIPVSYTHLDVYKRQASSMAPSCTRRRAMPVMPTRLVLLAATAFMVMWFPDGAWIEGRAGRPEGHWHIPASIYRNSGPAGRFSGAVWYVEPACRMI